MYSQKIKQAIITAITAHAHQKRKAGEPTPYAAHPIHVGLILQKAGFELYLGGTSQRESQQWQLSFHW